LEVGDTFLLCSDGLTGQLEDDEIGSLLAYLPPDEAIATLVDLANLRGGPDNITVVIAKITGDELISDVSAQGDGGGGSESRRGGGNPAAWVVSGICLLLAFFLWFAELYAPAGLSAVAGVVALIVGLVLWIRSRQGGSSSSAASAKFGKGPYVQVRCAPSDEFAQTLAGTLGELCQAAEEKQWEIDRSPCDEQQRSAEAAGQAGDHSRAVRHYARAISLLMSELRQVQKRKASDSSIEY
jgi:protein phosphatase